ADADTGLGAATATGDAIIVDTANGGAGAVDAGSSILGINIVGKDNLAVQNLLKGVDKALTDLTSAAAELGSISMRIGLQEDFASKLSDAMEKGIGRLVDAD